MKRPWAGSAARRGWRALQMWLREVRHWQACRAWDVEGETQVRSGVFSPIWLPTDPKPDRLALIVELNAYHRPWWKPGD